MKEFAKACYHIGRSVLAAPSRLFVLPREVIYFFKSYRQYRSLGKGISKENIALVPSLFGRSGTSSFDTHYVYQSHWAINRILRRDLALHVDVSSNIPFVASLAASVPVEFYEFRPPRIVLKDLSLRQGDLLQLPIPDQSVQSLSCLHVVEHVGLGRYGDPINPKGTESAILALGRKLAPGGILYLSLPIGKAQTLFNVHRISDPDFVMETLGPQFRLLEFSVVTDSGAFIEKVSPSDFRQEAYACGLYMVERIGEGS